MSPKGSRIRRRVPVKYEPAGPGEKLRTAWATGHEDWNRLIDETGRELVGERTKPSVEAVVDRIAQSGRAISKPTVDRHAAALKEARLLWQAEHGPVPEWNRRPPKGGQHDATAGVADRGAAEESGAAATSPDAGAPQMLRIEATAYAELVARAEKAEKRYERAKGERDKALKGQARDSAARARLEEENRRLRLAFSEDA